MDVNAMLTNAYKAEESRVYAANAVTDGNSRKGAGREAKGRLALLEQGGLVK